MTNTEEHYKLCVYEIDDLPKQKELGRLQQFVNVSATVINADYDFFIFLVYPEQTFSFCYKYLL